MARLVYNEATDRPTMGQRWFARWRAPRMAALPVPPVGPRHVGMYVAALRGMRPCASMAPIVRALIYSDIRSRQYRSECLGWYTQAVRMFPDDDICNFYVAGLAFRGILSLVDDERLEVFMRILRPKWRDSALWGRLELPRTDLMQFVVRTMLRETDTGGFPEERQQFLEGALQSNLLDPDTLWMAASALSSAYRRAGRTDAAAVSVCHLVFERVPSDSANAQYLGGILLREGAADSRALSVFRHLFDLATSDADEAGRRRWSVAAAGVYGSQGRFPTNIGDLLRCAAETESGNREFGVAAALAVLAKPQSSIEPSDHAFVASVRSTWGPRGWAGSDPLWRMIDAFLGASIPSSAAA